jgi:hypothetical protein
MDVYPSIAGMSNRSSAPMAPTTRRDSDAAVRRRNGAAISSQFKRKKQKDWPTRKPCSSDLKLLHRQGERIQPRVTFSHNSTMQVYIPDHHYARNKCYTKEDRQKFGSETLSEAMRIKRLVAKAPGESAKDSFKYLIKENIVSIEEIVGIEHLVLGNSASKLPKSRRDHVRAVLMEQERQHCDCDESRVQADRVESLRQFSTSRSSKSARRARIRAAMAA